MFIRDVMTTNVVTIPSSTSLADARRIMDAHRIRRLPVVDKGRLVGVVSRDGLDKAGPSKLTTFSMHELSYLLTKITVREIMKTDLVTVPPDATVEEAVALAQAKKVGTLLVVDAADKIRLINESAAEILGDTHAVPGALVGEVSPRLLYSLSTWRQGERHDSAPSTFVAAGMSDSARLALDSAAAHVPRDPAARADLGRLRFLIAGSAPPGRALR